MKSVIILVAMFIAISAHADHSGFDRYCKISGTYKITSDEWSSFTVWTVKFEDSQVTDSFTDSLSSREWLPGVRTVNLGYWEDRHILEKTEFGSDAIMRYTVVLRASCKAGVSNLEIYKAYESYIEEGYSSMTPLEKVSIEKIQ